MPSPYVTVRTGLLTQPLGKSGTKGQSWVDPTPSIVDEVTRGWERNSHLGKSL